MKKPHPCHKQPIGSRVQAEQVARKLRRRCSKDVKGLRAYKCKWCGHWHIGEASKQIAKERQKRERQHRMCVTRGGESMDMLMGD